MSKNAQPKNTAQECGGPSKKGLPSASFCVFSGLPALLVAFLALPLAAADWPEAGADSSRSAKVQEEIKGTLGQLWSFDMGRPAPSFPEAGRSDFWRNQVGTLKSRTVFDLAPQPVIAEGRLYLSGSHDDTLRCLDAASGKELWRFTSEAPLRCAPLLHEGKIFFGGDDGWLRCLDRDGKLLWETPPPGKDLIIGNGRLISVHAIRCGLIRVGDKFCSASGLFPGEACLWFSFDPKTGKILDEKKLDAPAQGYPVLRQGQAFLPTGNDAKGRTETIDGAAPSDKEATPPKGAYCVAFAGDRRFIGRVGGLAELDGKDKEIWSAAMRGSVRGLAFSDGRLIAVAESGQVAAFGLKGRSGGGKSPELPAPEMADAIPKSYALILPGQNPAELKKLLPAGGRALFLASDAAEASRLRTSLPPVASVMQQRDGLPAFRKGSFDLVVAAAAKPELIALLVPGSGRLVNAQGAELARNPVPEGVGRWSGLYADAGNSGCSQDKLTGTDFVPQWFGAPGPAAMIDRHLRAQPAVAGDGLMLIPGHEEIFCLNAWNGALLWRQKFPDFARVAALRDSSALALTAGRLALASGPNALFIEPKSGKIEKQLKDPGSGDWDFIAWHQGMLFGSSAEKGAIRRKAEKAVIYDGGYTDNQKNLLSTSLFAFSADGKPLWSRSSKGALPTPSICLLGEQVFCVEASAKIDEGKKAFKGRAAISAIAAAKPMLLSLDAKTGKELFRVPLELPATAQTCYLLGGPDAASPLLLCSSFNDGGKVRYRLVAFSRAEGKELWRQQVDTAYDPNMEHGEQDHHPLVIGDLVFCEPSFFNLKDGQASPGPAFSRGYGCGNASASATSLFFRSGGLGVCDITKRKTASINPASRAGCWINMLPANGLLLVPEASSGCVCNFAVQSSMAFAPK